MKRPAAAPDSSGGGKRRKERRKERRLARHARHARMIWNDPRSAGGIAREGLLAIWRARGGGLYGLGYVVAFVLLEVRLIVGELEASESLMSFVSEQLLEYLLRVGVMSFVNVLLAFLWPLFVLEHLGGWGLLVLVMAYFGFERWLRPSFESMFPELRRSANESEAGGEQQAADQAAADQEPGDPGTGDHQLPP